MPKPEIAGIRYAVMLAGTQKNLAKILGVSNTTVSTWVRQGYVTDGKVKEIHKLYGIPSARLCNPAYQQLLSDDEDT
jgi:transposase